MKKKKFFVGFVLVVTLMASLVTALMLIPDGRMIKLKIVAKIIQGESPIEIERKGRQKIIKNGNGSWVME